MLTTDSIVTYNHHKIIVFRHDAINILRDVTGGKFGHMEKLLCLLMGSYVKVHMSLQ